MKLKSYLDVIKGTQPVPLTKEGTEMYVTTAMMDMKNPNMTDVIDENAPAALRIMEQRLKWAGIDGKVSFPCKLFFSYMCDRPGKVVMWAYTLAHILELNGGQKVTMMKIAEYFPMGFPHVDLEQACWRLQKGMEHGHPEIDNMIDRLENWK